MVKYKTPGVYKEVVFPAGISVLPTGVPAFLGLVARADFDKRPGQPAGDGLLLVSLAKAGLWIIHKRSSGNETNRSPGLHQFTMWPQFEERFGELSHLGYLATTVRGFFENGGRTCYVALVCFGENVALTEAVREGLSILAPLDEIDLVCAPDIMFPRQQGGPHPGELEIRTMQSDILNHCDKTGDRFAILDSLPGADVDAVVAQRRGLTGTSGALYYPWIRTVETGFVPPSGHIAGVYARSDQRIGVHKAPANEILEGVLDVQVSVNDAQQEILNPAGVNCLRAFPGRGIRVWGARTLSTVPSWQYVSVRRLFLTAGRWLEHAMTAATFEPNDPGLWSRITREVSGYLTELFGKGALKGTSIQEAFFVKCDGENNPDEVREAGMVIADIGLATTIPGEFIVVRISHAAGGVTISTPPPVTTPVSPSKTVLSPRVRADLRITHVEYNPPGPDVSGEYVLIQNLGGASVDMHRWTLNDAAYHTYVFPPFALGPDGFVRIWTGRGKDSDTDLYWGRRAAIWNNVGDKAYLRDREGKLVATYPQNNG
jgi:hypothetical protein